MRSKQHMKGIALIPNKEKMVAIKIKLKEEFKKGQNLTAYELITKLNPMIKG